MYAVIRTGGKQYRVAPGDYVNVDKLDLAVGTKTDLPEVLMIGGDKTAIGTPNVSGAKVSVVVTEVGRGKKIFVFKKKRRHKYRRAKGHRQDFTRLFIESISFEGTTVNAEGKPHILDPNRVKKERVAKSEGAEGETKTAKASAKKAAPKKAATKKTGAKKKAAGSSKAKAATKKAKK
jgi:large subunit ribosomal protein L21